MVDNSKKRLTRREFIRRAAATAALPFCRISFHFTDPWHMPLKSLIWSLRRMEALHNSSRPPCPHWEGWVDLRRRARES